MTAKGYQPAHCRLRWRRARCRRCSSSAPRARLGTRKLSRARQPHDRRSPLRCGRLVSATAAPRAAFALCAPTGDFSGERKRGSVQIGQPESCRGPASAARTAASDAALPQGAHGPRGCRGDLDLRRSDLGIVSRPEETDRRDRSLQYREQADPGWPDNAPARLFRPAAHPPIAPGVPVLGPPLPGDLGRPIHNAQVPAPGSGEPAVDAEQQRVVQETEAARTSRLFATTNARERPATPTALPPATPADQAAGPLTGRVEPPPYDPELLLNMQDRKLAFLTAAVDRKTVSPDRLVNPVSPYVVQAGAVISAALLTGIRSDPPGQVTAQVTEHVYDTPTGQYLLIPQGSKSSASTTPNLVRTGSRPPRLDAADHAERPLNRAGAPARRRYTRIRRPGG